MTLKQTLFAVSLLFIQPLLAAQESANQTRIPSIERAALIGLFESTGGANWKHRENWQGPEGTECDWYGVQCSRGIDNHVASLDLTENGLVGSVPQTLSDLKQIEWLILVGNRLSGKLPEGIIERFLDGSLDVVADPLLMTETVELDFELSASSLLCGQYRVVMNSDMKIARYEKRCRNAFKNDRRTYCDVKQGRIFPGDFIRLGAQIEKSGFSQLKRDYDRNMTHGTYTSTRVTTAEGRRYSVVNYANAGPLSLWTIEKAIEGVAAGAEWEKSSRRSECPRWTR
jgi:hypothetical protein